MYGHHIEIAGPFDTAIERVVAALKTEGFGVLSDIDIQKAMKEKLGKDIPAHRILGACNPPLAYQALEADPEISLLLPCNVTVREVENGRISVGFLDPHMMAKLSPLAGMQAVADEAGKRLDRARAALTQ
ncbi:DUF302 domain-containing protein [Caenimonas sp. SL110]|uniref:DUF302 domain-containing protein n=1 Tax=Caenimonas sp. SL110 TaxID=1450524 RepID=UPI0006535811|nr:DUF302 domain-containing protein [Caenimonas sp. SL110]